MNKIRGAAANTHAIETNLAAALICCLLKPFYFYELISETIDGFIDEKKKHAAFGQATKDGFVVHRQKFVLPWKYYENNILINEIHDCVSPYKKKHRLCYLLAYELN